jgi:hypothetical protein
MKREMSATEVISSSLFFCSFSIFVSYNKVRNINYIERVIAYALQIRLKKNGILSSDWNALI